MAQFALNVVVQFRLVGYNKPLLKSILCLLVPHHQVEEQELSDSEMQVTETMPQPRHHNPPPPPIADGETENMDIDTEDDVTHTMQCD